MTGYNLCQQAFVLSMLSNQLVRLNGNAPDTKANLERRLYTYLTEEFLPVHADAIGAWEVVWGPAVYIRPKALGQPSDTGIPDNVIYIARKAGAPSAYVVAIAGTNKDSRFGWVVEDGGVNKTTTWTHAFKNDEDGNTLLGEYGNPGSSVHPCLAHGTAAGVGILLGMRPEPGINTNDQQPGRRALDYLAGLAPSDATLVIGGHSLGGALAPTFALALFNPNGGPLSTQSWGAVRVLPCAGATPGNADFASAFAEVFPGVPAQLPDSPDPQTEELWNRNIVNTRDIVPLAWVPSQLATIPPPADQEHGGLYPGLSWAPGVKEQLIKAITKAQSRSNNGAESRPSGGWAKAGPYTPLPHILFDCPEVGNTSARIISLLPPKQAPTAADVPPAPGDEVYLLHWLPHHSQVYANDIFKVGDLFKPSEVAALLSGSGLGLLHLAEVDADADLVADGLAAGAP